MKPYEYFAISSICSKLQQYLPFTVLKPRTVSNNQKEARRGLQQYLPFTVLKQEIEACTKERISIEALQQYLPFTVLKLLKILVVLKPKGLVTTVLTVYGIETINSSKHLDSRVLLQQYLPFTVLKRTLAIALLPITVGYNSTYRLRY